MLLFTIIVSLLPGFAWLFFFLREDPHPEPKHLLVFTFFMGILYAVLALAIENLFNFLFPAFNIQTVLNSSGAFSSVFIIISLLIFALIEELAKFGGAYFAIHKNPEFDEPIDAMIYVVVSALGFATLENLGALNPQGAQTALISSIFQIASLRFVDATLLHSLASSLVGYYWAIGIRELNVKKYLFRGILFATILHASFNYLILQYGNIAYTLVFLVIIGFFVLNDFEKLKLKII